MVRLNIGHAGDAAPADPVQLAKKVAELEEENLKLRGNNRTLRNKLTKINLTAAFADFEILDVPEKVIPAKVIPAEIQMRKRRPAGR